ncbi:MAG TPA: hypothetical protein VFW29_03470 [Solirubrobacteraceae bacterium]|nr:hypothetical protein [Solirubrobacteraceae bacterium]
MEASAQGPPAPARPGGALPAVVVLRPIGAPLTVGLAGLGIASLCESGLGLGWIAASETTSIGLVLLAVPFVLQILACVLSYLARDGAVGANVGVLATAWLALGLLHLHSGSPARDGAAGLLLVAAGAVLVVSSAVIVSANPLAGSIFILAALRFVAAGVYDLGGSETFQHAASIVGLVVAVLALYAIAAFELEGQRRHPVLPTLRTGTGREAVLGSGAEQLDGVAHEAGVRKAS